MTTHLCNSSDLIVILNLDSRYLPIELLNAPTNRDLTKCDIFSLGCTVYEIILGEKLPKNGSEWIAIREGKLRLGEVEELPTELEDLVQMMLQVSNFALHRLKNCIRRFDMF